MKGNYDLYFMKWKLFMIWNWGWKSGKGLYWSIFVVVDNIKIGFIFCIFKYVEYLFYKEVYLKLDMLCLLKMFEFLIFVEDGNCFFLFKENDFKCGVICYGGKRLMNVFV